MRILCYSHENGSPPTGGDYSLLEVLRELVARGHEVRLVVPRHGALGSVYGELGLDVIELGHAWWSRQRGPRSTMEPRGKALIRNLRMVRRHRWLAQDFSPDVIYSNTGVAPMGAFVASWLRIPHVWHLREFQTLDHQLIPDFGWRPLSWLFEKASLVIANSMSVASFFTAIAPRADIRTVYNGVSFKRVGPRPPRCSGLPYSFLLLGAYGSNKGHDVAIRACARLRDQGIDIRLVLGGSGDPTHVRRLVDETQTNDIVTVNGHVAEPARLYREADAYLMCSPHEAFGRVTVEAMLHGLPVVGISGPYCATSEIVTDGSTGLLCNPTVESVADSMFELVAHPALGRRMGTAGQKDALSRFSTQRYVSQVSELLEAVAEG